MALPATGSTITMTNIRDFFVDNGFASSYILGILGTYIGIAQGTTISMSSTFGGYNFGVSGNALFGAQLASIGHFSGNTVGPTPTVLDRPTISSYTPVINYPDQYFGSQDDAITPDAHINPAMVVKGANNGANNLMLFNTRHGTSALAAGTLTAFELNAENQTQSNTFWTAEGYGNSLTPANVTHEFVYVTNGSVIKKINMSNGTTNNTQILSNLNINDLTNPGALVAMSSDYIFLSRDFTDPAGTIRGYSFNSSNNTVYNQFRWNSVVGGHEIRGLSGAWERSEVFKIWTFRIPDRYNTLGDYRLGPILFVAYSRYRNVDNIAATVDVIEAMWFTYSDRTKASPDGISTAVNNITVISTIRDIYNHDGTYTGAYTSSLEPIVVTPHIPMTAEPTTDNQIASITNLVSFPDLSVLWKQKDAVTTSGTFYNRGMLTYHRPNYFSPTAMEEGYSFDGPQWILRDLATNIDDNFRRGYISIKDGPQNGTNHTILLTASGGGYNYHAYDSAADGVQMSQAKSRHMVIERETGSIIEDFDQWDRMGINGDSATYNAYGHEPVFENYLGPYTNQNGQWTYWPLKPETAINTTDYKARSYFHIVGGFNSGDSYRTRVYNTFFPTKRLPIAKWGDLVGPSTLASMYLRCVLDAVPHGGFDNEPVAYVEHNGTKHAYAISPTGLGTEYWNSGVGGSSAQIAHRGHSANSLVFLDKNWSNGTNSRGKIYIIDRATGAQRWAAENPTTSGNTGLGHAFIDEDNNRVVAFEHRLDGNRAHVWNYTTGAWINTLTGVGIVHDAVKVPGTTEILLAGEVTAGAIEGTIRTFDYMNLTGGAPIPATKLFTSEEVFIQIDISSNGEYITFLSGESEKYTAGTNRYLLRQRWYRSPAGGTGIVQTAGWLDRTLGDQPGDLPTNSNTPARINTIFSEVNGFSTVLPHTTHKQPVSATFISDEVIAVQKGPVNDGNSNYWYLDTANYILDIRNGSPLAVYNSTLGVINSETDGTIYPGRVPLVMSSNGDWEYMNIQPDSHLVFTEPNTSARGFAGLSIGLLISKNKAT